MLTKFCGHLPGNLYTLLFVTSKRYLNFSSFNTLTHCLFPITPMETSQLIAVESFSYSWLQQNIAPSFDSLHESLQAASDSFHEDNFTNSDYKIVNCQKCLSEPQNFNFDVPVSQSPDALLHADELFSDGLIRPVYVDPWKLDVSRSSNSCTVPLSSSRNISSAHKVHHQVIRRWSNLSKRVLQKCFRCLIPCCRKVGTSRKSSRVDDIDRNLWKVKSWNDSPQASPPVCTTYSVGDWHDVDSSIYEAILHCKRSIGTSILPSFFMISNNFWRINVTLILIHCLLFFLFQKNNSCTKRVKREGLKLSNCTTTHNHSFCCNCLLSCLLALWIYICFYSFIWECE